MRQGEAFARSIRCVPVAGPHPRPNAGNRAGGFRGDGRDGSSRSGGLRRGSRPIHADHARRRAWPRASSPAAARLPGGFEIGQAFDAWHESGRGPARRARRSTSRRRWRPHRDRLKAARSRWRSIRPEPGAAPLVAHDLRASDAALPRIREHPNRASAQDRRVLVNRRPSRRSARRRLHGRRGRRANEQFLEGNPLGAGIRRQPPTSDGT